MDLTILTGASKALGVTFLLFAAVVSITVIWRLALSFGRDIRVWWSARHPDTGWQPRKRPFVAIRRR